MAFKPGRAPVEPDFKRLLSTLNDSKVRERDTPLYEVIKRLIDWGQQQNVNINSKFEAVNQAITEIPATGGGTEDGDEDGNGDVSGIWAPLTDGIVPETQLIFDGFGNCIMVRIM